MSMQVWQIVPFVIASSSKTQKHLSVLVKSQVVLRRHHTNGVGVAHTSTPSLNTNDALALLEHSQADCVPDTPLEAVVDVLLPWSCLEVGLLLVVVEGVYAAVQVRVSGGCSIAGDHDDGADGAVLGDQTGGITPGNQRISSHRNHSADQDLRSRQYKDGTGILLERCGNSSHGAVLGGRDGARSQLLQFVECVDVGNGNLGQ